jgi:hypothetical protein
MQGKNEIEVTLTKNLLSTPPTPVDLTNVIRRVSACHVP